MEQRNAGTNGKACAKNGRLVTAVKSGPETGETASTVKHKENNNSLSTLLRPVSAMSMKWDWWFKKLNIAFTGIASNTHEHCYHTVTISINY